MDVSKAVVALKRCSLLLSDSFCSVQIDGESIILRSSWYWLVSTADQATFFRLQGVGYYAVQLFGTQ
jgi:hypothetical protein